MNRPFDDSSGSGHAFVVTDLSLGHAQFLGTEYPTAEATGPRGFLSVGNCLSIRSRVNAFKLRISKGYPDGMASALSP